MLTAFAILRDKVMTHVHSLTSWMSGKHNIRVFDSFPTSWNSHAPHNLRFKTLYYLFAMLTFFGLREIDLTDLCMFQ